MKKESMFLYSNPSKISHILEELKLFFSASLMSFLSIGTMLAFFQFWQKNKQYSKEDLKVGPKDFYIESPQIFSMRCQSCQGGELCCDVNPILSFQLRYL